MDKALPETESRVDAQGENTTEAQQLNLGASNADEWVRIPANVDNLGNAEFYVMKYEAKAWNDSNSDGEYAPTEAMADGIVDVSEFNSYTPVSLPDHQPWRAINPGYSFEQCDELNSELSAEDRQADANSDGTYSIISNAEWMAIARNIENVPENWTGGSVGAGCLRVGNSGETEVGAGNNLGDSCGYDAVVDPDFGENRNLRARHRLSTGEEIFDLAGNVSEWTDWDASTAYIQIGPNHCAPGAPIELEDINCPELQFDDYMPSGGFNSSHGMGNYFGNGFAPAGRGGNLRSATYSVEAGIYAIDFSEAPMSYADFGFRCVFRP